MGVNTGEMADAPTRAFERQAALRENSFSNELALIIFTIFAGLCGLWTENVSVTVTVFFGGVLAWMAYSFPEQIRRQSEKRVNASSLDLTKIAEAAPCPTSLSPEAALSLIASRRNIKGRDFDGQPVDRRLVEMVLEAANWAPSHRLTQPWRFVVLEGATARQQLLDVTEAAVRAEDSSVPPEKKDAVLDKLNSKRKTLAKVPYLIALGMKAHAVPGVHVAEVEELCATACAIQNLHLQATALGLAGFWDSWTAARDSPLLKEWLGLAAEDKCLGVFYLGRSERMAAYKGSRGPWQDKATWRS